MGADLFHVLFEEKVFRAFGDAVEAADNGDLEGLTDPIKRIRHARSDLQADLPKVIRHVVIPRLSAPIPCTVDDILDAACAHLPFILAQPETLEDDEGFSKMFAATYFRFATDAVAAIGDHPLVTDRFPLCGAGLAERWSLQGEDTIWSFNELSLEYSGQGHADGEMAEQYWRDCVQTPDDLLRFLQKNCRRDETLATAGDRSGEPPHRWIIENFRQVLWARVCMTGTERALQEYKGQIQKVIGCANRSWGMLICPRYEDFFEFDEADQPTEPRFLGFLKTCLGAYFYEATKKEDTLQRRLKNAILLLIESDNQQHSGIALALSFSAIEALTCSKSGEVMEQLSRNVATLLLHDRLLRPKAIETIRDLYDVRSKLLHGAEMSTADKSAQEVRAIAGQVLLAVFEWERNMRPWGEDVTKRRAFLDELKKAEQAGQPMIGVPEITSRFFNPTMF